MMKKNLLLAGLIVFITNSWACDLCSIYMNLEPNDLRSSIGFNYRYRLFEENAFQLDAQTSNQKHALGNTVLSDSKLQQERFNSYDLWANIMIRNKWQLNATLTFADNYYLEDDSILYNIAGPGDLSIITRYIIFNSKVNDSNKVAMRWLLGGGIKLPIGKFNQAYRVTPVSSSKGNVVYGSPFTELDPHLQAGTGSLDFLFSTEFLIRYNKLGFSTNLSYRINTENNNQFRFANRLNMNNSVFYLFKKDKNAIAPNIGMAMESSRRDQYKGEDYLNSGGSSIFATFGTKVYADNIALGFTYFTPITQQLNDNQLPNKNRITGDLTYYF